MILFAWYRPHFGLEARGRKNIGFGLHFQIGKQKKNKKGENGPRTPDFYSFWPFVPFFGYFFYFLGEAETYMFPMFLTTSGWRLEVESVPRKQDCKCSFISARFVKTALAYSRESQIIGQAHLREKAIIFAIFVKTPLFLAGQKHEKHRFRDPENGVGRI